MDNINNSGLFVKIRRAEWANDRNECLEMITRYKQISQEQTKDVSQDNTLSNQDTDFRSFSPQKVLDKTVEAIKERFEKISIEDFNMQYHSINSQNLRAIVYRSDEYIFNLRGYLVDLSLEDDFDDKTYKLALDYNDKQFIDSSNRLENKQIARQWVNTIDRMRIKTIVGNFGLFEMVGTWLDDSFKLENNDDILRIFKQNLETLDPQN